MNRIAHLDFQPLQPFRMQIFYGELTAQSEENVREHHVHPECEIYLNLSGDVDFMVENHLYPIAPGDVILTRPYEYHHCIYRSNALHKHFWILFSCEGNEALLDLFFHRPAGEQNRLTLPPTAAAELIEVCRALMDGKTPYPLFFRMLSLLRSGTSSAPGGAALPPDVVLALEGIHTHLAAPLSITALAQQSHVSLNTLERHFKAHIGVTPQAYLRQKRLARAAELLAQGSSVGDACVRSGFPDYAHFIALFRQHFGVSPLRYQRQHRSPAPAETAEPVSASADTCP